MPEPDAVELAPGTHVDILIDVAFQGSMPVVGAYSMHAEFLGLQQGQPGQQPFLMLRELPSGVEWWVLMGDIAGLRVVHAQA